MQGMTARLSVEELAPALRSFVADLSVARGRDARPRAMADFAARRLPGLLADRTWLPDSAQAGSTERYTQHVLVVAPDRSFSVVALVWRPGQATPIHDHVCWCVVGVYEGEESQTRYHLMRSGADRYLVEAGRQRAGRGDCSSLVPPEENIHRVSNAGTGRAISLHVYGADIEALGTSINQRFDDLPIRGTAPPERAPRSWRSERA